MCPGCAAGWSLGDGFIAFAQDKKDPGWPIVPMEATCNTTDVCAQMVSITKSNARAWQRRQLWIKRAVGIISEGQRAEPGRARFGSAGHGQKKGRINNSPCPDCFRLRALCCPSIFQSQQLSGDAWRGLGFKAVGRGDAHTASSHRNLGRPAVPALPELLWKCPSEGTQGQIDGK